MDINYFNQLLSALKVFPAYPFALPFHHLHHRLS